MASLNEFAYSYPWAILLIIVWSITIKGITLWSAARRGQLAWFIALLLVNTAGILEVVYLVLMRKTTFNGSRVNIYSPSFWGTVSLAKQNMTPKSE